MRFADIEVGQTFNTKPARWVKCNEEQAVCVMGTVVPIGEIHVFDPEYVVVPFPTSHQYTMLKKSVYELRDALQRCMDYAPNIPQGERSRVIKALSDTENL